MTAAKNQSEYDTILGYLMITTRFSFICRHNKKTSSKSTQKKEID